MKVVLVSPPWYPVPPIGYGGIELVVGLLANGLRRLGHTVHVLTTEQATDPAAVPLARPEWSHHLGLPDERWFDLAYGRRALGWVRQHARGAIIHDHSGGIVLAALTGLTPDLPVIHTVHGPLGPAETEFYRTLGTTARLVAISRAQAAAAPQLAWAGVVHNAVDVDSLRIAGPADKEPYLLTLARICPEKGQHLAIEIARRVGMRLVLAGKVEPTPKSRQYFETQVAPHVDGSRVVHLANVAGAQKAELLRRAWALLAPLQWEEPFGLAMVEAMASGTPVLATPRGAATELIEPGRTGFLADGPVELAELVPLCSELEPSRIAARARNRFSPERMAVEYEALYLSTQAGDWAVESLPQPGRVRLDDLGAYTREAGGHLGRPVTPAVRLHGEPAAAEPDLRDRDLRAPGREPRVEVDASGGEIGVQTQDCADGVEHRS